MSVQVFIHTVCLCLRSVRHICKMFRELQCDHKSNLNILSIWEKSCPVWWEWDHCPLSGLGCPQARLWRHSSICERHCPKIWVNSNSSQRTFTAIRGRLKYQAGGNIRMKSSEDQTWVYQIILYCKWFFNWFEIILKFNYLTTLLNRPVK